MTRYRVELELPDPTTLEIWEWIVALDAFDYGDPAPLEALIRASGDLPAEVRPALADIVAGKRKPNRRAAARLKVPAAERMRVAAYVQTMLGLYNALKNGYGYDDKMQQRRLLDIAADGGRREPIDQLRHLEAEARQLIFKVAMDMGVSVETIENLLRDLRNKIERLPRV